MINKQKEPHSTLLEATDDHINEEYTDPEKQAATQKKLQELYQEKPMTGESAEAFIKKILWRIFVEEDNKNCPCNRGGWNYAFYNNRDAFLQKWINDEIHYEFERRLQRLTPEELSQVNLEQLYAEVEIDILRAAVKCAVELFTEWNGQMEPPRNWNGRNLRTSLEPYLDPNK